MIQYLQDWHDACAYAAECLPPNLDTITKEPFPALASIAFVCIVIWWVNEVRLVRSK